MLRLLDVHTKAILKDGVQFMRANQNTIRMEWEAILRRLKQRNGQSAATFEVAYRFFSALLLDDKEEDVDAMIAGIRHLWVAEFGQLPQPNLTIYILTLLENAVHQAIQSHRASLRSYHPAVQYLFSKICEEMLCQPGGMSPNLHYFLRLIVEARQLPIKWIARLEQNENGYKVKEIYGAIRKPVKGLVINASSVFLLSEALIDYISENDERLKVIPLPWKQEILLFGTTDKDTAVVTPFLTFAMHLLQITEECFAQRREDEWKDAVILFNDWIMRSQNLHEAIQNITCGYARYLPFERCALFTYSKTDGTSVGLFGYHINNEAIQNVKIKVDDIPAIANKLKKLASPDAVYPFQPIYIEHAERDLPEPYVRQFQLGSLVVAPIYVPSERSLIGAALLDRGPGVHFDVDNHTYTALMKFGQSAGEILSKFMHMTAIKQLVYGSVSLSERELDVLKLLAEGASTQEAADRLHLSEYTVRDYVSDIMKRLGARNRTEAVVKAMRLGLIH
ncbi:helix-turn-helix transcriptional regulator [Caenibacillus caldisaponilyticus]|uniref:helix-turn-helix transcriptional regulator n=1 Tax=Caenibacillus caldisaponilyticus TaxID=1674942 RepID=UPI001EE70D2A|nr:response regulator transcription factor [Caenibacillus caldisaponilyticus]